MKQFNRKLRLLKLLRNALFFIAAAMIVLYASFETSINAWLNNPLSYQIVLFFVLLITVGYALFYEWRYGDAERYLNDAQCQINDAGYYLTARKQESPGGYVNAVKDDLAASGYRISEEVSCGELAFAFTGTKPFEFFYAVTLDTADGKDIAAYTLAAANDLSQERMKRKGEGVVLFVCRETANSAIAVSKQFTRLQFSRSKTITVYPVIVDLSTRQVYFLGNKICRAQKMAVNYVLNCEIPLKPEYICTEKLPFQQELAEKMEAFDFKAFKNADKKG